jgi:hypothetical protein
LLDNEVIKAGKMFGHPAYYVGGKFFAALFINGVCVKIPKQRV